MFVTACVAFLAAHVAFMLVSPTLPVLLEIEVDLVIYRAVYIVRVEFRVARIALRLTVCFTLSLASLLSSRVKHIACAQLFFLFLLFFAPYTQQSSGGG
ncbi:hypothetical protein PLICRDRAFT_37746 [Plicaturopsis crispa FD-325 SS-3]|nr:hypothetical protein PLICRDRAFT_37746 [Plicaturopsis crispa FD-325 SS-3]